MLLVIGVAARAKPRENDVLARARTEAGRTMTVANILSFYAVLRGSGMRELWSWYQFYGIPT